MGSGGRREEKEGSSQERDKDLPTEKRMCVGREGEKERWW